MEGESPTLSLHFHHQIGLQYLNQKIIAHVRVRVILLEKICVIRVWYNISLSRILDQEYCIPLDFLSGTEPDPNFALSVIFCFFKVLYFTHSFLISVVGESYIFAGKMLVSIKYPSVTFF